MNYQKLIVGLGNPEKKYAQSRHNTGWMVLDFLINDKELAVEKKDSDKNYELYGNGEILLMKPVNHMNCSGVAVAQVAQYYKIKPKNIWVINDDVDLALGKIKIRRGSSSAGHRGVQSIIHEVRTQDFYRFRVGIDNRVNLDGSSDTDEYVMADFREEEQIMIKQIAQKITETVKEFLQEGIRETSLNLSQNSNVKSQSHSLNLKTGL